MLHNQSREKGPRPWPRCLLENGDHATSLQWKIKNTVQQSNVDLDTHKITNTAIYIIDALKAENIVREQWTEIS